MRPIAAAPRSRAAGGCRLALLAASVGITVSCGGSPGAPGPIPQPNNQPPVITSVEIAPSRIEVNEEVAVRATVQDAETPVESLRYEWSADGGTFSGEGASVTWRPAADAATPGDFALRLTVVEPYAESEHRVSAASPPVRVHDSPSELREMSLSFLNCFADSSRSADECLVNFSDSCRGKQREREDIEDNREYYDIRSSSMQFQTVDIAEDRLSARIVVACEFRSRYRKCPPDVPDCVVGGTERVEGDCRLTAVYESRRWWLCDSTFRGDLVPSLLYFFGGR